MNSKKTGNRVGRPRLIADKARSHRVATFVTESELDLLRAAADQNDKSISILIYEILTKSMSKLKQTQTK